VGPKVSGTPYPSSELHPELVLVALTFPSKTIFGRIELERKISTGFVSDWIAKRFSHNSADIFLW